MKKICYFIRFLPIFILVTGLVPFNLASAQADTVISISGPATVNPGEQFTVNILVEPATSISGAQFDLAFDSSLVSVDNVTEGNLLSQGGASTYFAAGTIDNIAGTVTAVAGAITTPGQTVSTSGTFAILTLTAGTGGGTCSLTLSNVVVGDINGQSVPVTVVNGQVAVNQAPLLNPIGAKSGDEAELLTFFISATDADGDQLTYSASNLPEGASFDPNTRIFSWTPRYDQAGVYTVHFEVSDGELADSENVSITVVQLYEDWDINGDDVSNVLDMILIGQHWDETGLTGWIREDANEDGAINVLDMIIIGQHWTE
jgi:hypothetical protein